MAKGKVVLAYSGGLDTSVILHWLAQKGYEVIALTVDLGQKENFKEIKERALKCGASKFYLIDKKEEFVKEFIFPLIRANAVYEGKYLMGSACSRPLIAKTQIEIAKKEKAEAVAHGATGKGNDQVRFELTYLALCPQIKIISPWKDKEFLSQFKGRRSEIEYAKKHGIFPKNFTQKPWSIDENIMHTSFEGGELEDPMTKPKEEMFQMSVSPKLAPEKETEIEIEFEKGNPKKVKNLTDGTEKEGALELFTYLNDLAGKNGIGRIDIVENRFLGIKSRGVYETPAGTVLIKAHRDLEGLTMDREVMHLRDMLIPKFAQLVYFGFWFSPEMEVLRTFFDKTQEFICGKVRLTLYKGNVIITGRQSPFSLYNKEQSSMEIDKGFDPQNSIGFIRIHATRLINYYQRKQKIKKFQTNS